MPRTRSNQPPSKQSEEADLSQISDVELLQAFVAIVMHDHLTDRDRAELTAINHEFVRRDSLAYLPTHSRHSHATGQ